MNITVDARGLSCPIPQQMALDAVRSAQQGEMIIVLVDEAAARDSVVRAARALQLPYQVEKRADEYKICILREEIWIDRRSMPGD